MRVDPIDLIVFDLGHVLIDVCDGWLQAFEQSGIAVPQGWDCPQLRAAVRIVVHRCERGELGNESFAVEVARLIGVTSEDVMRLSRTFLRRPYSGAIELVVQLDGTDVELACLSNTNPLHWSKMNDLDDVSYLPLALLDYSWVSYRLGLRKPDPQIYEYVEVDSKVAPQNILFFDNLVENIDAARRRGWRAQWIRPDGTQVAQLRRHLQGYQLL